MKLSPFKGGDDTTQFGNMGMKISMVMRSNEIYKGECKTDNYYPMI